MAATLSFSSHESFVRPSVPNDAIAHTGRLVFGFLHGAVMEDPFVPKRSSLIVGQPLRTDVTAERTVAQKRARGVSFMSAPRSVGGHESYPRQRAAHNPRRSPTRPGASWAQFVVRPADSTTPG